MLTQTTVAKENEISDSCATPCILQMWNKNKNHEPSDTIIKTKTNKDDERGAKELDSENGIK